MKTATQKGNVNFLENGLIEFDYILIIYIGNGPKSCFVYQNILNIKRFAKLVGFEILTVMVMKSSIFWCIMLFSLLKVN
jgi:hypothetical protein